MREALDIAVTLMTIPFSSPTVSLNSSASRFMGESACSPYTCHSESVTGSFLFSSEPEQPPSVSSKMKSTSSVSRSLAWTMINLLWMTKRFPVLFPLLFLKKPYKNGIYPPQTGKRMGTGRGFFGIVKQG